MLAEAGYNRQTKLVVKRSDGKVGGCLQYIAMLEAGYELLYQGKVGGTARNLGCDYGGLELIRLGSVVGPLYCVTEQVCE